MRKKLKRSSSEHLSEIRDLLVKVSRCLPARHTVPVAPEVVQTDLIKAGQVYAEIESKLFDALNALNRSLE